MKDLKMVGILGSWLNKRNMFECLILTLSVVPSSLPPPLSNLDIAILIIPQFPRSRNLYLVTLCHTGSFSKLSDCDFFLCNKNHKLPFGSTDVSSSKPLELIYTNAFGLASIRSCDNSLYYIILYYFSKYPWFILLFYQFKSLVENFFQTKIKTIYFDGGDGYQILSHMLANHYT